MQLDLSADIKTQLPRHEKASTDLLQMGRFRKLAAQ
jgi:hypothetical protein